MTARLYNRVPITNQGDWIQIVPKGELPNAEAGVVQVLDDQSHDAILANIAKDKARLGDNWPGVYAGREHFIYDDEQDSAALAWFKDFEKRPDGIWANANGLTDTGREAIKNAHYKYTSFVANSGDTQSLGGNRVRILKIDTVGFTNAANGKNLLTPITNRPTSGDVPDATSSESVDPAEAWCLALVSIFQSLQGADVESDMGQLSKAWQLCKAQRPELYAALFGDSGAGQTAPAIAKQATDQMAQLTNRIRVIAKCDFDTARSFVRQQLPTLFNRHTPPRSVPVDNWPMNQRLAAQMFSEVVRLVRNRIGGTFHEAHRLVMATNQDLFEPNYDNIRCAQGFSRMLNRREQMTGLAPIKIIERSAESIRVMTRHFSPSFLSAPTALQWDILNRAAAVLGRAGVASRICNRATSADVSAADAATAKANAGEVLDYLTHKTEVLPNDIGVMLQSKNASATQIWRTFYAQIKTLMSANGLSAAEAFKKLQTDQPLFWTMAMLSFSPEATQ